MDGNFVRKIFLQILNSPRWLKQLIMVSMDTVLLYFAMLSAFSLNSNFNFFDLSREDSATVALTTLASIYVFSRLGLYRAVIRFLGNEIIVTTLKGTVISSAILFLCLLLTEHGFLFYSVFIYFVVTLCLIAYSRLIICQYISNINSNKKINVAIYGANDAGLSLLASLKKSSLYNPVALIDEKKFIRNISYNGTKVYSPEKLPFLIQRYAVQQVLLAIPNLTGKRKKNVIKQLETLGIRIRVIPTMEDLLSGSKMIEQLQDIQVEDLLGRDPVKPISELLQRCITKKTVLVTGSGGSIGSELCRQIVRQSPSNLILLERSEEALYQIDMELKKYIGEHGLNTEIIPLLACVQNGTRLKTIFSTYKIDTVYHAAAYKHVPLIEYNINEGVRNNVFGTYELALASKKAGVKNFVLISTDKAVRPTNIMGTSKRLAELILQALAKTTTETRFSMVRFGNVLGSSGSVVPLFNKQIAKGGPITVTHPEIIRYFMTIPEAAQLVIQAGAMASGGDVFVLDMGEPVKIVDLAQSMIRLHGFTLKNEHNPAGNIEILFTGLRPGEKLFEELLIDNNVSDTSHPKIKRADEHSLSLSQVNQILLKLAVALDRCDCQSVHDILLHAGTDYTGSNVINDLIWKSANQDFHPSEQDPIKTLAG